MGRSARILISAAEASSCLHAYHLVQALLEEANDQGVTLELFGIGDDRLKTLPFDVVVPSNRLLAMGTTEVLARLPDILRAKRTVLEEARLRPPDLAVLLDYPGFHFKLAADLRACGVRCLSYIPPKVWVWKRSRLKRMKTLFARVLCIFPFEREIYQNEGIPSDYIGNPLLDELPMHLSQGEARRRLGFSGEASNHAELFVALLPGSRPGELKHHLPLLCDTVEQLAREFQKRHGPQAVLQVLVPFASDAQMKANQAQLESRSSPSVHYHLMAGRSAECMVASDVGLIKSGTSTLEAGVLGLPHVVVYRPSAVSVFLFEMLIRRRWLPERLRGYQGPIGLVNLFTGWKPGVANRVPEFFGKAMTPEKLVPALSSLLWDPDVRSKQQQALRELRDSVCGSTVGPAGSWVSPSRQAARIILSELRLAIAESEGRTP